MSQSSFEMEITNEARRFFNYRGLRKKDLMEWSTAPIGDHPGEITAQLPESKIYVSILAEHDKRKRGAGGK